MKLSLIDLSSIFWSSLHATAGEGLDAVFSATMARVDRCKDGFDRVAVCCDIGPSWRKTEFPGYKANRPPRDQSAYDQLRRVREALEAEGVPTIASEGFEADDCLATLAAKAAAQGYHTTIFTGDSDLLQLVGDSVVVHSTNNGGGVMDREAVKAKLGVYPERVGDYKALVGDSSDAIPGLEGCGPKNAVRLLEELGSLDAMLEQPAGVTPEKMREKFIQQRGKVILARKLVALSFNVPLDFEESTRPRERKVKPAEKGDAFEGEFEETADEPSESGGAAPTGGKEGSETGPVVAAPSPAPPQASEGSTASPPKPAAEAASNVIDISTALVLDRQDPRWMLALEPRGPAQLMSYCRHLAESQLYRKFPNADSIMAVVLRGRALGLDMTTALDVFNVIKGKPTMGAMAIVGLCLASGKVDYFDPIEVNSDTTATWETLRKGGRNPVKMTYTIEDARRAGLVIDGTPWVSRPKEMLRKQAAVVLARLVYPDVVSNIYDPDELTD